MKLKLQTLFNNKNCRTRVGCCMNFLREQYYRMIAFCYALYIRFVYWSSKVEIEGKDRLLQKEELEKFIFIFWHGESFSLYPVLKGRKSYIIVTSNSRGNYISPLCRYFGYFPIRLQDKKEKGNSFHILRKVIENGDGDLTLSLDGPVGSYHCPKDFPFTLSIYLRRRIIPISLKMKRKLIMKKRWDHFIIPLPFNSISVKFHEPEGFSRIDRKDDFSSIKLKIKTKMELHEKS